MNPVGISRAIAPWLHVRLSGFELNRGVRLWKSPVLPLVDRSGTLLAFLGPTLGTSPCMNITRLDYHNGQVPEGTASAFSTATSHLRDGVRWMGGREASPGASRYYRPERLQSLRNSRDVPKPDSRVKVTPSPQSPVGLGSGNKEVFEEQKRNCAVRTESMYLATCTTRKLSLLFKVLQKWYVRGSFLHAERDIPYISHGNCKVPGQRIVSVRWGRIPVCGAV